MVMYNYLIVGAGPSGLCAAKTILQCEPLASVKILDSNKTIGGVWAEENLYPGLKTNNVRGGIDFSDFPMDDAFGIAAGKHPTGEAVHRYLRAYAERSGLIKLIDFETKVLEISRIGVREGWNLKVSNGSEHQVQTQKLIIATGATNVPHRPRIEGTDAFKGPLMHSGDLGKQSESITKNPSVETIAVLGGGKSAYDAVYLAATAGRKVEWIIRKTGKGPEWIFPSHTYLGPFKALRERLPGRRIISVFSPTLWKDGLGTLRYFLHFTSLGRKIAQKFWANLHLATLNDCGMLNDEATKPLEPETGPFWYGTASGVLSYEKDIYDFLKNGQVRIHRQDISRLSERTINFTNGTSIHADALVTATGFSAKPTLQFVPESTHSSLGIPSRSLTQDQVDFWDNLNQQADATISKNFPRLLIGPHKSPSSNVPLSVKPYDPKLYPELNYTPFRLYRAIAPPGLTQEGDNSLVFISMFSNLANTARCEIQCLWAYAYLNDKIKLDTSTVFEEAALTNRYVRHRAPYGHGRFIPDLVFDQLPYFDTLLNDLKLRFWRKGNVFSEIFAPYTAVDYKSIIQEWLGKNETVTSAVSAAEPSSETTHLLGSKV